MTRALPVACGLLFGGLVLALGPALSAAALLASVVVAAVLGRPQLGLYLFALLATTIPFTTVNVGVRITACEAVLALTWFATAVHALGGRMSWPRGTPERLAVVLIVWSLLPLAAGIGLPSEGNGIVSWLRWVLNVSLLFLVPLLVRNDEDRDRLLTCVMLGFLAMLLLSLGMFAKERDARSVISLLTTLKYAHPEAVEDIFSANYTRMASPWVHPNSTGGALLLAAPLALYWGLAQQGARRSLGFCVAALSVIGIVFSGSRGALLALAVLLIWMAWRGVPYTARMLSLGIVLAVAMAAFYPPVGERIASLFTSDDASTSIRLDEYRRFPEAMARFPLGVGFNVDPPPPGSGLIGISNLWLNYIYKIGIPGMLIFAALMLAWWREVRDFGDVRRIDPRKALWFGSVGSVLAALATGFIDHYFSFTQVLIALFWMVVAISLLPAREARARQDSMPLPVSP